MLQSKIELSSNNDSTSENALNNMRLQIILLFM